MQPSPRKPIGRQVAAEAIASSKEPLQVRIPQDLKRRFKAHAAIQGMTSNELFVKVWEHYERTHS